MARIERGPEPVSVLANEGTMLDSRPIVFVVDDDVAVREALSLLIESAGWRPETFASGMEFLARVRPAVPSCLLLDVLLPALSGHELQKLLLDQSDLPIIFVSGQADVPVAVRAMKAGAMDFFLKPLVAEALLGAIGNALDRSRAALIAADALRKLRSRYDALSRREREVMALVVTGRLNKQVGGMLGISEITVKAHRGQMMRKMQADSLPDLVEMATRLRHG